MSGKYGTPTNLLRVKRRPRQHSKGANICVRCLCQFAKGEWMIPSGMTAWRHGKPCQRTERSVGRSDVCGLCGEVLLTPGMAGRLLEAAETLRHGRAGWAAGCVYDLRRV